MKFKLELEMSDSDVRDFLKRMGYKIDVISKIHVGVGKDGEPIHLLAKEECAFKNDEDIELALHYKDVFKNILYTCVQPAVKHILTQKIPTLNE